jgi:nicotinamide-nucleotide amidase
VKFELLGVTPGPVVSADCAREMAQGVRSLLDSDVSISTTGVGGPDELEGQAVGTVFIAASVGGSIEVEEHHFDGDPHEVVEQAVTACMALALKMLALA